MRRRLLIVTGGLVLLFVFGVGIFAYTSISAFDESLAKVYDVPPQRIERSADPAVLARGRHLLESLGACTECHGENLGTPRVEQMGPIGNIGFPNVSTGKNGRAGAYSDGELARLIQHGIRRDGTTVRFMPSMDFSWWPNTDVVALVSYFRTLPPVDSEAVPLEIKSLGKVLDRLDMVHLDIARRINHQDLPKAPEPAPTKEYGAFVGKLCVGCHGEHLSGGPIPGAPSELPTPLNLTPHETGLKDWMLADFKKLLREGMRKNGLPLQKFMSVTSWKNLNETEIEALWAYLQSLPPMPLGNR